MTWDQANAEGCNNLADGAYLASVTYNNKGYLSKQDAIIDSYFFWVGLRSGDDEWNKGTPHAQKVDYTNWETVQLSEPSGSRATNDDCVTMVPEYYWPKFMPSGHWLDWQCDSGECQYICELRQVSPRTMLLAIVLLRASVKRVLTRLQEISDYERRSW